MTRLWKGLATAGTAGALGLSLLAGPASAAAPAQGVACTPSGKINARGATFARNAWATLADGYRDDVCGSVPDPAIPAGTTGTAAGQMIVYNDYTAAANTGSGNGRQAASFRSDAFGGSDGPYTDTQLSQLRGLPGATGGAVSATLNPPFMGRTTGFPAANDIAAPIMSFPIGGSSVTPAVNLSGAACGTTPSALTFTKEMVDGLFDGTILTWNSTRLRDANNNGVVDGTGVDAALAPVNTELATCTGAVQRLVRADSSGTTSIFKFYLAKVDPTTPGCDGNAARNWITLRNEGTNITWPTDAVGFPGANTVETSVPATANCSAIASKNGNALLAPAANTTLNSVSYLDLSDAKAQPNLILPSVRNATDTDYIAPDNGNAANCNYGSITTPGGTPNAVVGLGATNTWSSNQAGTVHSDLTQRGTGYPICGLTFGLVYTGLSDTNPLANDAISSLNNDQRRTLYSFMSYALSSAGQDKLTNVFYQRMPVGTISLIRTGFQNNF